MLVGKILHFVKTNKPKWKGRCINKESVINMKINKNINKSETEQHNCIKIKRNSLLYKSRVEYADFCINHVMGCSHGCKFPCYAMLMAKRFGRVKTYDDWIKPKLVSNALELLDKEIPKYKHQIKTVHLCFMTDPFMEGYEEIKVMSLKIIEKLSDNGIKTTVLTKGIYPKELTDKKKYNPNNEYGITIVSSDPEFQKEYEPYAASYQTRINALKYLHSEGLKTWVSIEPYPTPNIVKQDLMKMLNDIKFADKIIFGRLNYNSKTSQYKEHKQFYNACSKTVIEFCNKNNMSYHIKNGTQT